MQASFQVIQKWVQQHACYLALTCVCMWQAHWQILPTARTLLDVDAIAALYFTEGRHLDERQLPVDTIDTPMLRHVKVPIQKNSSLHDVIEEARALASSAYTEMKNSQNSTNGGGGVIPRIVLVLEATLGQVNVRASTAGMPVLELDALFKKIFSRLLFSPEVVKQAQLILAGELLHSDSHSYFNGVHLRVERDSITRATGSQLVVLEKFLKWMRRARYGGQIPLFVASGIFDLLDDDPKGLNVSTIMQALAPYGKSVVHHEVCRQTGCVGERSPLAQFHPEQLALVDFIVLAQSKAFIGRITSFTTLLISYRFFLSEDKRSLWFGEPYLKDTHIYGSAPYLSLEQR